MTHIRTFIAICALALPAGAFAAGCGGDDSSDSSEDPQTVLDETFNNPERVTSGDFSFTASGSVGGEQGGSFDASLSGPLQGDADDPNAIPQLAWDATVSAEGSGQSFDFSGGLTLTEDNAYIEYGDQAYELGSETFTQLKDAAAQAAEAQGASEESGSVTDQFKAGCEAQIEAAGGDPSACDFDISSWLLEPTNDGVVDVEGADAIKISSGVDVGTMLQDLFAIGSAVPGATGGVDPSVIESQLGTIEEAVDEASFSLYSGAEDKILRGLDFTLSLDPSAIPGAAESGVDSIDVGLEARIGAVNEPQTIEAPSEAQPIDQLFSDLGIDPSALGALGGGLPGGLGAGAGGGGTGGGGGGQADKYLQCLNDAQTPEEITACADSL